MDNKDRQILRALQRNGRMTNLELAEQVNLSPSPCLRRVRNLEKAGVLKGYSADVDAEAYGLALTAFVRITLEKHNEDTVKTFERRVIALDEVQECHMLTGPTDYLLRVVVAGLAAYEDFIRTRIHPIGGIGSIDTSFVYGTVKKSGVYPMLD